MPTSLYTEWNDPAQGVTILAKPAPDRPIEPSEDDRGGRGAAVELEVVIPLYNEEGIAGRYATALANHIDRIIGKGRWRFILVNNGSTDGTGRALEEILADVGAGMIINEPDPNYGRALRAGLQATTAPYAHTCDIEQWDVPFLAWAWHNRTIHDLFIGSRRSDPTVSKQPPVRRVLSWGLNALIQLFFGYMGTDTHGPKLINMQSLRPTIGKCISDRGQYDTEIVLRATRAGLRIAEAPIAHNEKRRPRFAIAKKIGWNLVAFNRLRRVLRDEPYGSAIHFHQFSRTDVIDIYENALSKTRNSDLEPGETHASELSYSTR